MLETIRNAAFGGSGAASVIISIALILICGFAMTRITKLLKLPNVTAYIITGMLLGPYCLDLVPQSIIDGTDFISDIALAFIAFGVGEFFTLDTLKKSGRKVVIITVFEALAELHGLAAKLLVGQRLVFFFKRINLIDNFVQAFDLPGGRVE